MRRAPRGEAERHHPGEGASSGSGTPPAGRPITATIDLGALRANLRAVRRHAPGARIMAIIKANGYGHGIERAAAALEEADAFGVAGIDEALALRAAGIHHGIVLLEGFFSVDELPLIAHHGFAIVVHHEAQIRRLAAAPTDHSLTVWLKIDTGMHRLGLRPHQVEAACQRLRACGNVAAVHFMTHFACADERDNPLTRQQTDLFHALAQGRGGDTSLANSAAILHWPASHAARGGAVSWVRPGIMLYGVSPFPEEDGARLGLRPVMTLTSRLIAVNDCLRGDAIGYGATWRCPEDMRVGVVAAGYGDGYPRGAVNGTPVLVRGERVPLVGRVSMDMLCVDLRACPEAAIGDEVVLWGGGLPVEEVARHAGTIAYELLCGVTPRVRIVEQGG